MYLGSLCHHERSRGDRVYNPFFTSSMVPLQITGSEAVFMINQHHTWPLEGLLGRSRQLWSGTDTAELQAPPHETISGTFHYL